MYDKDYMLNLALREKDIELVKRKFRMYSGGSKNVLKDFSEQQYKQFIFQLC